MFWGTRGDRWGVDYAVGQGVQPMQYRVLDFKRDDVASIEGHIITVLAEEHGVPATDIHVSHIIRMIK